MTVGERIRQARDKMGLKRPALAEKAKIPYSTLAGIENNDQSGTTQLPQIASALGVSVHWLQTGKGSMVADESGDPDWKDVLGYAQAVGAGAGTEVQEYAETHALKFRANSLRRKGLLNRRLAVYYASGDSMEPRIHSGDALLFDQDDVQPVHNGLYIVTWRGEQYVKRIKMADDIVLVESDNPRGDHNWGRPKRLDNKREPVSIVGRVRWIGSWED
ncbi:helix-turn-helix transcriptional regulator [Pseudoxanthomonas winnipegensis]|uniref:XRE family transcriptional regulator n=1 Tax=Pseudoxanthomonas winnipegensis TaxID=2480810 RepID=UPI00102D91AD|nr:S24 family peptidase [Pseudoxanthomonas winnipegensis]TAA42167.1 helix-turn-helix transcriptional regulator [Pseudoxanthomonas winnipegensis]